ncbi:MAG: TIR domain-containing protein [Methanobacterium sp.]|nr:TIR domain-containing protein [Methanobacterium sp.]
MFEDDYNDNLRQYNLFISHNGEGDEEYLEFIRRLVEASDFEWKDHGIPNKNSQDDLRQQINNSDIVIILSGLYSKHHDLIKNQVDLALQLNKPIILIRPYGLEEVPAELEKIAKGVVGWNRVCIVEMIQESLKEE